MPHSNVSKFILFPELKLTKTEILGKFRRLYHCHKKKVAEVCPRCATLCQSTYDSRVVVVEDAPIRGTGVRLKITKRRLYCPKCKKPFTEPLHGILPRRRRTTQRFRKSVAWAAAFHGPSFSQKSRNSPRRALILSSLLTANRQNTDSDTL